MTCMRTCCSSICRHWSSPGTPGRLAVCGGSTTFRPATDDRRDSLKWLFVAATRWRRRQRTPAAHCTTGRKCTTPTAASCSGILRVTSNHTPSESLARQMAVEIGKPLRDARQEVTFAVDLVRCGGLQCGRLPRQFAGCRLAGSPPAPGRGGCRHSLEQPAGDRSRKNRARDSVRKCGRLETGTARSGSRDRCAELDRTRRACPRGSSIWFTEIEALPST